MEMKATCRRDNTSPKPNTNTTSIVNTLIQAKDEVHTKLLEETKKTADLSNMFSTLDEQLRASIEKTLRNLKTELDKQRKRLLPGIRRLEDASKSLKKSESILDSNDSCYKNADVKKATRRIKDAKRVVQEFLPSNSDIGIHTYITDQINSLCHRIKQIPLLLKDIEAKNKYNIPTDKSIGSDSDSFGSPKLSPNSKVRYRSKETLSNKSLKQFGNRTNILNGVEIFSSDSETLDEDFETGQYIPIKIPDKVTDNKAGFQTGESIYAVIGDDSQLSTEYLTPLEITKVHNGTNENHNSERSRWRQGISSTSTPNRGNLPFTKFQEYNDEEMQNEKKKSETTSDVRYVTTRKPLPLPRKDKLKDNQTTPKLPLRNNISHLELASDKTNVKELQPYSYVKANGIPKRLLPSVPKGIQSFTKPNEELYSTVDNTVYGNDNVDGSAKQMTNTNKTDLDKKTEKKDIEEIKFEESVETCRQNIIDKLKEKYTIRRTPTPEMGVGRLDLSTTIDSDFPDFYAPAFASDTEIRRHSDTSPHGTVETNTHLSNSFGTSDHKTFPSFVLSNSPKSNIYTDMVDRIKSPNTHWSKLVIIDHYSPTQESNTTDTHDVTKESGYVSVEAKEYSSSDSLVSKGIMKFEATGQNNGTFKRHFPKSFHLKKSPLRPRSISAEGVPLKTTIYRYRSTSNLYALAPRSREPIQVSDYNLDSMSLRNMGSVEMDLDKLCNESKHSIRREWSQRRAQSLQNTPKTPEKVNKGPSFVYTSSFKIPDDVRAERCHISSIVMMADGKVVLLDQRHRFVYTFDRLYNFKAKCPVLEFPGGMVALQEDKIAVAYPYKSKIGVYRVELAGSIQFLRDIFSPCSNWVNGIGFAKGHLYLLCKGGDVHVMTPDNTEVKKISVGMNGRILVHPSGRRFYIIGEGRISKFDVEGSMLSSTEHVGAYSLILLNDILYAVDRQKHRIVSVKFGLSEEHDLISKAVEYPSAVGASATGEQLLVSQFEESIDVLKTRTIHVYKLQTTTLTP